MMRGLSNALKGIGGNYELNRLVGAFGGLTYIICANVFVGYDLVVKGREFDITAYCLAFPGGLAAIVASIAGAVAWKDAGVAKAKAIEQAGASGADAGQAADAVADAAATKADQINGATNGVL